MEKATVQSMDRALSIIEALSMGCPVIRSKTPGWSAISEGVLVFEKRDNAAFQNLLAYAYTHREEMKNAGKRGRELVFEEFTIQRQVDKTVAVYERCI